MTLTIELGEDFLAAADEWGESRRLDDEEAIETKVEQALLEIEHLVSGAVDVAFEVDADSETVTHEPSDDLEAFLERQATETGLDPDRILKLHVDLFARAFLEAGR
ncbi:hypothetical protein ACFQGT_09095 [Natrialbaceae archaeon GCM10025810]|uniref:hypothetical protein n=1 Tax=Halovalidus salilacus TaxID=3075124 RepID=UPI0036127740